MPKISVVVPIYNVEAYLGACLDSIARQTVEDLECIMVDDGGTDSSAAIAAAYAERDPRFKLVSQANRGLSGARNTGTRHATGEYLAFVDSDDVLPPERLRAAARRARADRLGLRHGQRPAAHALGHVPGQLPLAHVHATELATHVTRFRPLLADRIAWNKLFRRSFWDAQGYEFPEGRIHEDIPVIIPAQFAAKSVDVISDPVYYWRIREGGDLSITQRRLEIKALNDRMQAVEEVSAYLEAHGPRGAKRWYEESVVADDLRLHLNVLDRADDDYRQLFLERVNAYLDGASPRIYRRLAAIDRLKWHLVRRRLLPELLEVLRFQKEDLSTTPPVRVRRRWYGDYPFRDDPRLKIPASVYRLVNADLPGAVHLDELRVDGGELLIRGFGYITGIGAPAPGSQKVSVVALQAGRLRRVRLYLAPLQLATETVRRPDATARSGQALTDLAWAGFEARLDPAGARGQGGRRGRGLGALRDAERRRHPAPPGALRARPGDPRRRAARGRRTRSPAPCRPRPTGSIWSCAAPGPRWTAVRRPRRRARRRSRARSGRTRRQKAKLEAKRRADAVARRVPLDRRRARGGSRAGVARRARPRPGRRPTTRSGPTATRAWCGSSPRRSGGGRRRARARARPAGRRGRAARRDGARAHAHAPGRRRARGAHAARGGGVGDVGRRRARWRSRARSRSRATPQLVLRLRDGVEEHAVPVRGEAGRFTATLTPAAIALDGGHAPAARGHVAAGPARRRRGARRR